MLIPIHKVLTKDLVHQLRETLGHGQWLDGKRTAGAQASGVKSNQQMDDQSEPAINARNQILHILGRHQLFLSAALPHKIFPPQFNRYCSGNRYGAHIDNAIMPMSGTNEMLRTDLSVTLFLSEPDEYEGGELTAETMYGAQEIKLNAGDMILYPSTSLHNVTPVTRGARICSFFWIQSLVRDNHQRALLFDLDQSIQVLTRKRGGKDNEVRRLTGVYHNLVRMWAEG